MLNAGFLTEIYKFHPPRKEAEVVMKSRYYNLKVSKVFRNLFIEAALGVILGFEMFNWKTKECRKVKRQFWIETGPQFLQNGIGFLCVLSVAGRSACLSFKHKRW